MIKVNLLHSVTERQGGAVATVDRKISSPASRLLLMSIAAVFLLAAVIGIDVISSQMSKNKAEADLAEQKRIEQELAAVLKEQKELEQKIQNIDKRIAAIKKLRDSQAGPSAVLDAMRERIAMVPGLYLESVEQAGEQLIVKGNSPDEQAVTQFGRSLEFSGGLFSNLSIEMQRKEEAIPGAVATTSTTNPQAEVPKLVTVGFTIKCAYTPTKANTSNTTGCRKPAATATTTATTESGGKSAEKLIIIV